MVWAGHVACMRNMSSVFGILVNLNGKGYVEDLGIDGIKVLKWILKQ
jgi:hypothetical protein